MRDDTPIGYQGVPGAYSEQALLANYPDADRRPSRTLPELFSTLISGDIVRALVPIENSYAGSVDEAYDLMLANSVSIVAEHIHPVEHALLATPGASLTTIKRVFSHPQALAQTSEYLLAHHLQATPYYDTAGAAEMVAENEDSSCAAVASRLAADYYGLAVLADNIQTARDNSTRFVLLCAGGWSPALRTESAFPGKTALAFSVEHHPGALVQALESFAQRGVNLLRLASRPSRQRPWEYVFFAEAAGYEHEPRVHEALGELSRLGIWFRVLGSYKAAHA
ncbi:MAG: prephenate dehydratase [Chloroflexota bacterium]